jgi:hypothetical protein
MINHDQEGTVLRVLMLMVLVSASLLAAGCGGSSDSTTSAETTTTSTAGESEETESEEEGEDEEESATPAETLAEIAIIRTLLDDAVAQYATGAHEEAADAVGDIYLEHFEKVEGPLGDVDHDLMEEIEEQISTELRNDMQDGGPQGEIESLVAEIKTNLDKAEEALG